MTVSGDYVIPAPHRVRDKLQREKSPFASRAKEFGKHLKDMLDKGHIRMMVEKYLKLDANEPNGETSPFFDANLLTSEHDLVCQHAATRPRQPGGNLNG